jgi:hypothetical protein
MDQGNGVSSMLEIICGRREKFRVDTIRYQLDVQFMWGHYFSGMLGQMLGTDDYGIG